MGGRNQQFALACARKFLEKISRSLAQEPTAFDGNSKAAGAIADLVPPWIVRDPATSMQKGHYKNLMRFPCFTIWVMP